MIERMKKITVLVSENEKAMFISMLRRAGVLHIKHVEAPEAHEIKFIEDREAKIEKMIDILSPYASRRDQDPDASDHEKAVLEAADRMRDSYRERQAAEQEIWELKKQMFWYEPWGWFDPSDVGALREKGVYIRLYRVNKPDLKKLEKGAYRLFGKDPEGYYYIATIDNDPEKKLPFDEIALPGKSPRQMAAEIDELSKKIVKMDSMFKTEARSLAAIKRCEKKLDKEHESLMVRFGMKEEGRFSYLQGFCPAKRAGKIVEMAKHHGLGYLMEEPDDPDETPTLITNPKWVDIIRPVFQFMNTLPGYNEFDISLPFLVFFSLFFAMLIGDAGYGILFLAVTFLARRRFRGLAWQPFFLLYLLSAATIVWGAVTGTWFGAETIAKLPVFSSLVIQSVYSFSKGNQDFLIFICFIIGVVQLTIAHLFRIVRMINSPAAVAQAGWILILWGMFFAAGKFVIGRYFPPGAGWMLAVGIIMVLFFSNTQKGFLKGALTTLVDLPLSVIGSFSDIVSYLRLFAVGYATVIVASSFNDMALAGGVHSVIGAFGSAMVLFFGHLLNIILGFMAVIVHGIRLNMLEFSGHLGMQWSGKEYEPFREGKITVR